MHAVTLGDRGFLCTRVPSYTAGTIDDDDVTITKRRL